MGGTKIDYPAFSSLAVRMRSIVLTRRATCAPQQKASLHSGAVKRTLITGLDNTLKYCSSTPLPTKCLINHTGSNVSELRKSC